jgi:hypothetical protein
MMSHGSPIRGIDSAHGNALFKRDAQDQDYIDTLQIIGVENGGFFFGYFGGLPTSGEACHVLR